MVKKAAQTNLIADTKDPDVTIFGNEISPERVKHRDSGGAVLGVFLIFIGILLLLNYLGIVPWQIWESLYRFWPVLIILGGLHIVLGHNLISKFLVTVLSVLVFGYIFLLALNEVSPQLLSNLPPDLLRLVEQGERWVNR